MPDTSPTTAGRVRDKVALVTGAASGIGRAAALRLAAEGASVAAADLNEEGAAATARAIQEAGGRATSYALDVSREEDWPGVMSRVLADFGRLDVAVNGAGIAMGKPLVETTLAEWRRVITTNLDGVFLGTQAAIRAMRTGGRGSIINVASVAGVKAQPGAAAYCASKAGSCMVTRVAALECAQAGLQIRVNAVLPGGVTTPIWRQLPMWADLVRRCGGEEGAFRALAQGVPLKRYADANEVAGLILYLASDESAYVTGAQLTIDGGLSA
jgi:3(or 17)beta-hydroxysteroid dehydrogenase